MDKTVGQWASVEAYSAAICCNSASGDWASIRQWVWPGVPARNICRHHIRRTAVRLQRQIRFGLWLACLQSPNLWSCYQRVWRQFARDAPCRGKSSQQRCTSWPCLPRWAESHRRPALLHQFRFASFYSWIGYGRRRLRRISSFDWRLVFLDLLIQHFRQTCHRNILYCRNAFDWKAGF